MACVCSAAAGQVPSRTSPMPRRYCSTSSWSTNRRGPPLAVNSIDPRYRRLVDGTATVDLGSAQSVRFEDGGGFAPCGGGGGTVVVLLGGPPGGGGTAVVVV